jgi:hypothetical protein
MGPIFSAAKRRRGPTKKAVPTNTRPRAARGRASRAGAEKLIDKMKKPARENAAKATTAAKRSNVFMRKLCPAK